MMVTIRAGILAMGVCLLLLAAGCSREQQDWRSAEAADTIGGYSQFIQRHPESELATQARTRVTQLGEDRDWQHAGSADTATAYRQFIAQHPNGKWAQEARIRIENFSLGVQPVTPDKANGVAGVADSTAPPLLPTQRTNSAAPAAVEHAGNLASPGEAAVPAAAQQRTYQPAPTSQRPSAAPVEVAHRVPSGAPATNTAAPAGFAVQLGAFSSEASANNEWRTLTSRFGSELQGLPERVVTADIPSGRIYRLQAAVSDEPRARALCSLLKKRAQACVPVLPH